MNLLQECVRWDVHVNFWTRQGCKTLFSNSTHTTCEFDYISTYAVIKTLDEADDLKILPIVIISVTNCCVAGIIIMFAVLCWKRVKVRFSECSSWRQTLCSHSVFFLLHTHPHLFTARLIFVTPVQTRTKPVAGSCSWCCCQSSKSWENFYALPDPSTTFFTLPDPTSLHSARGISTQESVSTTMCSLLEVPIHNRPPLDVSML